MAQAKSVQSGRNAMWVDLCHAGKSVDAPYYATGLATCQGAGLGANRPGAIDYPLFQE